MARSERAKVLSRSAAVPSRNEQSAGRPVTPRRLSARPWLGPAGAGLRLLGGCRRARALLGARGLVEALDLHGLAAAHRLGGRVRGCAAAAVGGRLWLRAGRRGVRE